MKKYLQKNGVYYLLWLVGALAVSFIIFPLCSANYINYDSAYQYFLNRHSLSDIMKLLPQDYSPPFYTLFLKALSLFMGTSLFSFRAMSLIVVFGMQFLSLFPIRHTFGRRTSLVSFVFFTFSSIYFQLLPEIRPTVFAYFFVTACAIYCYIAFFKEEKSAYILFTVFSSLGMYTHNIALVAIFTLYLLVGIYSLIKKDFKKLLRFVISGTICFVAYLPWLFVLITQVKNVAHNYWSARLPDLSTLFAAVFSVNFYDFGKEVISFVILMLCVAAPFVWLLKKLIRKIKKPAETNAELRPIAILKSAVKSERTEKAIFLILEFLLPLLAILLFCKFVFPIAAIRYFYIFSGIAGLIFCIYVSKFPSRTFTIIICLCIILNSFIACCGYKTQLDKSDFSQMIELIKKEHPDGNISFLHTHEWSLGIMEYYFPNAKNYIYNESWTVLNTYDVFPGKVENIGQIHNISKYTDDFYMFDEFLEKKNIIYVDKIGFDKDGYTMNKIGTYTEPYSYQKKWKLTEFKK